MSESANKPKRFTLPHTLCTEKGPVTFRAVGQPIVEVPAHTWTMECEVCGERFTDGQDAGNHEITTGHRTSFVA